MNAENLQRGCFCIDVTCDNLLDAVKHTVEEESLARIKQLNAELVSKLREYAAEEQALATKVARFEAMQESVPLEISTALELARHHKAEMESKMTQLQVDMLKFTGLAHCEIDLIEPGSGALKNLRNDPRRKASELLQAGHTYEAARLGSPTSTPLVFLSAAPQIHSAQKSS